MIQDIADALAQSWHNFARASIEFVPRLVAATIIFAGGLLVAILVRQDIILSGTPPKRKPIM